MASNYLHMLDVRIRPCAYIKDVISGCWRNVVEGVNKENGKIVYGFKVVGESRLVLVLNGGIEGAMEAMNSAYGDQVDVECTPLRTYESFAEHVLGVDKTYTSPSSYQLGHDGHLFWLKFNVEYIGLSLSDLLSTWKTEAITALSLRLNGKMEIDLFKTVGQRQVHVFAKLPNCDLMDDIVFTLPIMKEMGDQVHITTKSVVPIS